MKIISARQLREEIDVALWDRQIKPHRRRRWAEMVFRLKMLLRLDRGGIAW